VVENLRRASSFTHRAVIARSTEVEELFGEVQSSQGSGGTVSRRKRAARTQAREFAEEKEGKG
jgi:hypothetical protein